MMKAGSMQYNAPVKVQEMLYLCLLYGNNRGEEAAKDFLTQV